MEHEYKMDRDARNFFRPSSHYLWYTLTRQTHSKPQLQLYTRATKPDWVP